jgi:hypothetical protein
MNDLIRPETTMFDAWLRSGVPWQPLGAVHDAWHWFEASSAMLTAAMELQQALWQPWWDAQGEWLRQCGGLWQPAAPVLRGAEQLA